MRYLQPFLFGLFLLLGLLSMQPVYAQTVPQQLNVPQGSASLNWAGYVAQSGSYTSVTGSWVVPTVSAAASGSADAAWVGIGGVSSHDLIQAGTQAIVSSGGTVSYQAWVETLPNFSQTVPLTVSAGDSITTTLTEQSAGGWLVTIRDNSTGQSYQTTLGYQSSLSSAEWVEEMISNGNGTFKPLDSFGTVTFTGGSTVMNGQSETLAQAGAEPLQMINRAGQALATTSALGGDGASFSVTRTSASAAVTPRSYGNRWRVIDTATSTGGNPSSRIITVRRGRGYRFVLPQGGFFSIIVR